MPRKQKEYFCGLCNLPYDTFTQFEEHHWSMLHHRQLENKRKVKRHFCTLCKQMWPTLPEYGVHLIGERHKNAVHSWSMRQKNTDHRPNVSPSRRSSLRSRHQRGSLGPSVDRSRNFMCATNSMPEERRYGSLSANRILPLMANRCQERRISTSLYYHLPHSHGFAHNRYTTSRFTSDPWYNGNTFDSGYSDGPCHNVAVDVSSSIMTSSSFAEDNIEREALFEEDQSCTTNLPGDLYVHIDSPMTGTNQNSLMSSPRDNFSLPGGIHPLARDSRLDKNPQWTGTDKEKYNNTHFESSVTDPQPSTSHNHHMFKRTQPSNRQSGPSYRQKNQSDKVKNSNTKVAKLSDRLSNSSDGQSKGSTTQDETSKRQSESSTRHSESSNIDDGPSARYTTLSARQSRSTDRDTETSDRLNEHSPQKCDTSTRESEMCTMQRKPSGRLYQTSVRQSKSAVTQNKLPTRLTKTSDRQSETSKQSESSTRQNGSSARHSESSTRHGKSSTRHSESSTRHSESSTRHSESYTRHSESSTRHSESFTRPDEMTMRQNNPPGRQDELSTSQNRPSDRERETSPKQTGPYEPSARPTETSTRQNKPSTGQFKVSTRHTKTSDSQTVTLSSAVREPCTKQSQPFIDQTDHTARQNKFPTLLSNPSVRQIDPSTGMNQSNKLESQRNVRQGDLPTKTGAELALNLSGKEKSTSENVTTRNCNEDMECGRAPEESSQISKGNVQHSDREFERVICKVEGEMVETTNKFPQVKSKNDECNGLSSMHQEKTDFSKDAQSTSARNKDQSEARHGKQGINEGMVVEAPASVDPCPPQETLNATDIRPVVLEGNHGEDCTPSHRAAIASSQRPFTGAANHSAEVARSCQSSSQLRCETEESNEQVIQPCTDGLARFAGGNVPSKSVPEQGKPSCSSERATNSKLAVTSMTPSVSTSRLSPLRGNKSSACRTDAGNVLLHDLIRKHLEKLQRCRASRPNLTSSRVQHYPSQHADSTLSDLKRVLLHLFERPMSSSRKKLQEIQLRKLLAKASDSSERFKRFGVHLETFDRDEDEMIKLLETLTEEDLELLSKQEDSKEDLRELLSLFELAEDPSLTENVQVACQMAREGDIQPEEVLSMSDSSSDVEVIESTHSEVIVLSENEEDEPPILEPPKQSQPGPANTLHDQVFQLSLKEHEFAQKLKAMRKEQKTLEANIKRDTANLARLKKSRVEMKKQVKALRKNRLKLTKGHSMTTKSSDLQLSECNLGSSSTSTGNLPLADSGHQQPDVVPRPSPLANNNKPSVQGTIGPAGVRTQSEMLLTGNVPFSAPVIQHGIFSPVNCKSEPETCGGQSANQMVGQFSIPPSAMGISIQRISEEEVLMLAGQEALKKDLQSQGSGSTSSLNLEFDPTVQTSNSAPGTRTQSPSIYRPTQQPLQVVQVASIGPVGGPTHPVSQAANVKQLNNPTQCKLVGNISQAADGSQLRSPQSSLLNFGIPSESPNIIEMKNQEKLSITEESGFILTPEVVQVDRSDLLGQEGATTSQTSNKGNVVQPPTNCIALSGTPQIKVTRPVEHSQSAKDVNCLQAGSAIPSKETPLVTTSSSTEGNIQQGVTSDSKFSIPEIIKEAPLSTQLDAESSSVGSPYPVSISNVHSSASLEEVPVQGSATNCAIIKEEPLDDQPSVMQESTTDLSGSSRNQMKSLPDTNASKTDPPPQSSEEDGASSKLEQARRTRLRSRDTFMKQYSCKRKRQLPLSQLPSSKKRELSVRTEESGDEDATFGSKRMQPKVVLTRLNKSDEPLPLANKSTEKNLRSQRKNAASSGCSQRSHNETSENSSRLTPQSNSSQKARRSAPAPNLTKGRVRLTQKESSCDNVQGHTNRKRGKASPYSFENMQRRVTETERRQLGLLTSQLISKHLKMVKRYQKLGLSDFYIQIARKGKVASKQEIAMLKKEAKRVRGLKKDEGKLQTATKPGNNPTVNNPTGNNSTGNNSTGNNRTGTKSAKDKRELKLQKKVKKKEERLELFRTFGMSEEFLAIMAKGGKATKKEQSDLSKEINKKQFMQQYRAAKKCSRRLVKVERMEQRKMRQRMRPAARNQLNEYILSTMETNMSDQPHPEASRNLQSGRQFRNRKNDVWKSKIKPNQHLLPAFYKTAVIGLGVVGDKLYSCSVNGAIKVYNSKTLHFEASYSGHQNGVTGLHVHHDNDDNSLRLFTCSQDHQLQCRTICNSKMTVQRLDFHHPVTSMVAADGSLFLALANGHVDVLNIKEFKCYQSFALHDQEIRCLTVADFNDKRYLVTGTHTAELSVHSITADNFHYSLEGHRSSIFCIQVAGNFILSGSSDCRLLQHDFSTKEFVMEYTCHTRAVTDMKVHQSTVYTACLDDTVRMINFQKMELIATVVVKNVLSLCKIAQNVYVGTTDGKVEKLSYFPAGRDDDQRKENGESESNEKVALAI